jgi:hypothetical protein
MKKSLLLWFAISVSAAIIHADISISTQLKSPTVTNVNGYAEFINNRVHGKPGCPLLASESFIFLVPPDADLSTVSIHIQGLNESVLDGNYEVKPASPPFSIEGPVWPEKRNIVDGKDVDVYSCDKYYPESYIQDISVGKLRCYKLVKVRIYLSRYNPISGKIKCLEKGKLVLECKREALERDVKYKIPVKFKKLIKNIAGNYDEFASAYNSVFSFSENTKYIIMTESSIQSASTKLEELKDSKIKQGFDVEIMTESDWGGGTGDRAAENIRSWLEDNYQSMNIEYVLFIGDPSTSNGKVPMKNAETRSRPTDFYYEALSGEWKTDLEAEVTAARIPVYDNDMNTLDNILTKLIQYENQPKSEIGWRTYTLFATKPYASDTWGDFMFETFKEEFIDVAGWPLYRIYDDEYGTPQGNPDETQCTKSAVVNAWKSKNFGIVLWMTHGSATSASDIMSSSSTPELGDEYPPIVFMGSCSNATITNSNNLAYAMLKNAGIGAIGGTGITWYGDGQKEFEGTSTTQGLMYHFLEAVTMDSLSAGDAYVQAVSKCVDREWWNNIAGYSLFGCPDIGIFTCANSTPIIDMSTVPAKIQASAHLIATLTKSNEVQFMLAAGKGNKDITLTIYDARGNVLHSITQKKFIKDSYRFSKLYTWDLNKNGPVSSGIYFTAMNIGDSRTGRVVSVKDKFIIRK